MDLELRELIRDFLNDEYIEEEMALKFDLEKCNNCGDYEFREDLIETPYGVVCESCKKDIDY